MLHSCEPTFCLRSENVSFIATGKYLPNRMMYFFRQALEDSIGRTAVGRIWQGTATREEGLAPASNDLEKAVDFSRFAEVCSAVEGFYGEAGARAVLYPAGRAAFFKTLRSTSAIVGLDGPGFYSPSGSVRIETGLQSVVRLLGILSDMECSIDAGGSGCRFHVAICPECIGRTRAKGLCFGMAGLFRAALDWFGVDPEIPVVETECGAPGCAFFASTAF
jgi:predicted hydrocarbon binding protein